MCSICGVKNIAIVNINLFTDIEINDIIYWIKSNIVSVDNLYYPLYSKTAEELTKYLYLGYGNNIDDFQVGSVDYEMLFDLRENLYIFSSAKQYQFIREVNSLKKDDNYENKAKEIYVKYYENYLFSELDSTEQVGINVKNWLKITNNG